MLGWEYRFSASPKRHSPATVNTRIQGHRPASSLLPGAARSDSEEYLVEILAKAVRTPTDGNHHPVMQPLPGSCSPYSRVPRPHKTWSDQKGSVDDFP